MKEIYTEIIKLIEKRQTFAIATITHQAGSSPRGTGTKMLVMQDGSDFGTIGGGLLEKTVIERSLEVINSSRPICFTYRMEADEIDEAEMTCGGNVEIFIEPVIPENSLNLQIYREITEIIKNHGAGLLATVIDPERWHDGTVPRMFIKKNGEKIGALSFNLEMAGESIQRGLNRFLDERKPVKIEGGEANAGDIFIEPIVSNPGVYIFGGGHVSKQITPLAAGVGFDVEVIDDRPEWSDPASFPDAREVHTYSFDNVMERLGINEFSYLVIVTRGHAHDKTVLEQALRTPAKYIGMIGSKRKVAITFKTLLEEGFTQEDIDRVFSPIGVEIGAETPQEIAVSVVAELIKVKAGA